MNRQHTKDAVHLTNRTTNNPSGKDLHTSTFRDSKMSSHRDSKLTPRDPSRTSNAILLRKQTTKKGIVYKPEKEDSFSFDDKDP